MPAASIRSTGRDRSGRFVLRRIESPEELDACLELQKRVWGEDFADLTPPALLRIASEVGGVAAGAFDTRSDRAAPDRLAGFVFGISGLRDGDLAHWSHMMAVLPEFRGLGLGVRLKVYQRELLLERGIETAFWTYDPLVARNAYINIMRLGARPVEYRRDYYGTGEDSALSAGLGTDRFVTRWELSSEWVERTLDGCPPVPSEEEAVAPVVNVRQQSAEPVPEAEPERLSLPDAPVLRVEIPADIQAVRDADPERAAAWRSSTRHTLGPALALGYRVTAFLRTDADGAARRRAEAPRRFFYLLTRSSG